MGQKTGSAPSRGVNRNRNEKGVTLVIGTLSMLFIIPMMGLAIDVGFLYAVKSKLQASVDGAALASARALSIGSSLSSQTTTAQAHAVTWFNSNFPSGYFGTYNTIMGTNNVNVYSGTGPQAQVRNVTVSAQTTVDTFFMKWVGFGSTTIAANGNASRRTVVAMLVLDRSGSMCAGSGNTNACAGTGNTYPCSAMVSAAKAFVGQFAEGSDYIGLVSFSDSAYIHSAPVQNFQSVLGYTNASGSGTGALDTIGCYGGTSTATGMSVAYQLLYQTNLPGALNVLMLETDGLPNTLTMNFWDSTNAVAGLQSSSGCKDGETTPKTMAQGGFSSAAQVPTWTGPLNMLASPFLTSNSYYTANSSTIPAGMIAAVSSSDPGDSPEGFWATLKYFSTSAGSSTDPFNSYLPTGASGCHQDSDSTTLTDIGWWPKTDVFSNSLNPTAYTYESVTTDTKGHLTQTNSNPTNWKNYHLGVLNATDNSAYNFRSNATIPATVFTIGLGGNSTTGPPDPVLLQRMANDPNGDEFNTTGPLTSPYAGQYYYPCSNTNEKDSYGATCVNYSAQPQGTFIYAPNSTYLAQAFLRISSQVLRLSK